MADYCTYADIKTAMPDSPLVQMGAEEHSNAFAALITRASRLIDKEVGRWANYFYPTTDGETRYFDGNGEEELWIDECLSITSLAVAESGETCSTGYTTWASTEYQAWPYNYAAYSQPILRLDIDLNGDKGSWTKYRKAIKLTGVFGYSSTPPEDIKQACIIQVMRWYMRAKQAFQDAGASVDLGQMIYVQQLDPDVRELLMAYKIASIV